MKTHLLTDSGKIYVVQLPNKPNTNFYNASFKFHMDAHENYEKAYAEALANRIEFHPDCVDEAEQLLGKALAEEWSKQAEPNFKCEDNHPYLIEGLKVEIYKYYRDGNLWCRGIKWAVENKQYAIISIEQLKG